MEGENEIRARLRRQIASGRLHTAYLLSGMGPEPRDTAHWLARAACCEGPGERPARPAGAAGGRPGATEIPLDGTGKSGPLLRHVGDHPDLLWVERGATTRACASRQVRACKHALRLRTSEGGARVAVIADAEWLNQEAQNALLRTARGAAAAHHAACS